MSFWLPDIPQGPEPIYQRLAASIETAIENGTLAPDTRLPSHRDLAYRLGVAVGTVARAYETLVEAGVLESAVGRGTVVCGTRATNHIELTTDFSRIDMRLIVPPRITDTSLMAELGRATFAVPGERFDTLNLNIYPLETGDDRHRRIVSEWCSAHGVNSTPGSTLITCGGQEAILALVLALNRRGSPLLCENLSIASIKNLSATVGVPCHGVDIDEHGVIPEALESAARKTGGRLLIVTPELHVPTGARMPAARRREIAAVARAHDILIVEYIAYALWLGGSLDDFSHYCPERTLSVQSFSSMTMPGLRCSFLNAPPHLIPRVTATRYATVIATSTVISEIAASWIETGVAGRVLNAHRAELTARHAILSEIFPEEAHRTPVGSPFVWLELVNKRAVDFVAEASANGVEILSSDRFHFGDGRAPEAIRASISTPITREALHHGLKTLRDLRDR